MPVVVTTPSRLHFGLLRFEQTDGPSYGGLGMMIADPRWVVELDAAEQWAGEGAGVQRALEFARHALHAIDAPHKPQALRIRVRQAIPAHRGLGGGTQLGLAITAGIRRLLDLPDASAAELAAASGRGQRSAVGAHGFIHGGLLWEKGRPPGESIGQLAARVALPEAWRIVVVDTDDPSGLSGQPEVDAFRALPPVPVATTQRLEQLAEEVILPAAQLGDLAMFGEALYEYGRTAGECFAPVQGGPYASPAIARCVRTIRQLGVAAAGQSSWGPTVFAVTESIEQAKQLCDSLANNPATAEYATQITAPNNHGATMKHLTPRSLTGG
jgi:beta-ribofuranosylaminobenzene 5'-phosphate synthase